MHGPTTPDFIPGAGVEEESYFLNADLRNKSFSSGLVTNKK